MTQLADEALEHAIRESRAERARIQADGRGREARVVEPSRSHETDPGVRDAAISRPRRCGATRSLPTWPRRGRSSAGTSRPSPNATGRPTWPAISARTPWRAQARPGRELGFAGLEKSAGEGWPDTFEALDLRLVPVRAGVVYGTYRYRVRYGADEHSGLSERFFLKTPEGWRIAVSTAFDAPPGTPPPPRALVGATLVDGTGAPPIPDAVVLVRDGRIECVGTRTACPVPEGVTVLDLAGRWVTPGIVDAHVHFSQTGWADGRPDALDVRDLHPYEKTEADLEAHPERWFRSYLCSGVTAVFDVGGYSWTTAMAARTTPTRRRLGSTAAGPLLSTLDHWLNLPAERQFIYLKDEAAAREGVRFLASRGAAAVKVWYIVTPERPVEASAPAVLAAGRRGPPRGAPAHRPRHGPGGSQDGAARRRAAARPQRGGPARRRGIPRPGQGQRHDLLSDPHRLRRLPPHGRGRVVAEGARDRRPERVRRPDDASQPRRGRRRAT